MALPKNQPRNESGPGTTEGGGDMALALTSAIQGQANEMAIAAQAAAISIDHASDQLSDLYAEVFSRRPLLNATLAKTAAKLEAMGGPITIDTEVQPITLDLPSFGNFDETRRNFLGMFGGNTHDIPAHYIVSGPDSSDSEGEDNV
jgi:hypothetical protein